MGTSFLHALQSPVSALVQHCKTWPSQCVFVLDGLSLSVPAFKASLPQFLPYAQRTDLMLHYLESMNTYYAAQAKQRSGLASSSGCKLCRALSFLPGNCRSTSYGRA